jgi:alpha-glucosidase
MRFNFFKTPYGRNIEAETRDMKYVFVLILSVAVTSSSFAQQWRVTSPDGTLQLTLQNKTGVLTYAVTSGAATLVKPSTLGIETNETSFSNGLTFVKATSKKINETYTMMSGKRLQNQAKGNETSVLFRKGSGLLLRIDLRAYNDGVAFRYAFPGQGKTVAITAETTTFTIPTGGKFWAQPYDLPSAYTPAYESVYENGIAIGTA